MISHDWVNRNGFTRKVLFRSVVFFIGLTTPVLFLSLYTLLKADTGIIEPNGNGSIQSSQTTCGAGGAYDCLNDGVLSPTAPSTGGDFITLTNTKNDFYLMDTIPNVSSVSSITLYYYHVEGGSSAFATLGLFAANEVTQYGTTQNIPNRSIAQWDSVTFSGLALTQTQLDDLRVRLDCEKSGGGPSYTCNGYALYAEVTYTPKTNVLVSAVGTQQNIDVASVDAYVGGAFRLIENENCTSCAIDEITIRENGTIDAQNNLSNIELWYDLDTTGADGYNCSDESFNGDELQFGATDTDGFSAADGTATFSGNVPISTTQAMCVYVVLDVGSGAAAGETIEIEIVNPATDVSTTLNQVVRPETTVALAGTSVIQAVELDQIHYHWRNDDGDQGDTVSGATSATGGSHDTPYTKLGVETPIRLRLEVSNEGNKTSLGEQYRLEFAKKVSTCSAATGWADVGAAGGDFDMYDSPHLTNGDNTTDINNAAGGVPNENTTLLSPNGGVRDTSSQTGTLTLTPTEFVELEYSVVASTTASEGDSYCFRVTNAGTPIDVYTVYPETTIQADLNVTTVGSQPAYIDIPSTDVYMGGFAIIDQTGAHTIEDITIHASGTIDYINSVDNIELWYDLDTTGADGYNCSDQSFNGDELQYGSTVTGGFSAGGDATFSQNLGISNTSSVCLYVILDVLDTAADAGTLDIEISDPSVDIVTTTGTVSPNSPLPIFGVSTVVEPIPTMVHYHWREDLGSETTAPSATDGNEDTPLDLWKIGIPKRLRLEVSNEGSTTTGAYQYRLEFAPKISTCAAATGWTDVGAAADEFDMYNSANLTDGSDTTNIPNATGGVTDEEPTFLVNNNAVKDTSSQTADITLLGDEFVELEYSIVSTVNTTEGSTYCFRVTNAGTPIAAYDTYAEAKIKPPTDFFIQRNSATISGTSVTLTAGVDYIAPASASNAFIRITNTQHTGAGDNTSPANSNADDVTAYIVNPQNIGTSIDIARFGASGNTRVDWEIIEFTGAASSNNEIIVREQSTITFGTAATAATTGVISGIQDDADVVVFITGQGNPDTGRSNYNTSLATAAWNAGTDTATFTRGEAGGDAAVVSYAVVEFVGDNWNIQRSEHTYTAVGTIETEAITAVNSLSRTFLHTQKRAGAGLNTHANIGHEVWLSGIGQVSFLLDNTASTPAGHTSVAWVIENIQTNGTPMAVTRSNGTQSGGAEPSTFNISIGKTLNDIEVASIFINNRSSGAVTTFPQPIIAARLISETQYELWVSKTSDTRNYRTEIVEWPTGDREISQNYYRFYVDNDLIDPTDPWPEGATNLGDNTEVTIYDQPIAMGEVVRLRMTLAVSAAKMNPGVDTFKLQFGKRESTCTAIPESQWYDIGDSSSTTALWRGHDGSPVDGTALSTDPPTAGDLNITAVSDVAGTYEENNPTAVVPYRVNPGEDIEYDWAIEHNAAEEKVSYCFRMIEADGTLLKAYNNYPTMRTAGYTPLLSQWRFYDDETNATPSLPLASENTAPIDIAFDNILKLRVTVAETTGGLGTDKKFKLQYSEYSDFSDGVYDVVSTTTCATTATTTSQIWCYADGAGVDDDTIDAAVLSDADSCIGGIGAGCGTYNESGATTTATTYDQLPLSVAEYEFTIRNAGARANAVYYFRLFDLNNATTVAASTSYPSLLVEGASLAFTISSVPAGTVSEGVTADVTSTPASILFGSVPFNTPYNAIYRLNIDTNATEGYQMLMYATQPMTNTYGDIIPDVTGTNAAPTSWASGCLSDATGCFGYHVGDDTLAGGSTRFAADDTYAGLATTPQEVMHSLVPANDSSDIVYRIQITDGQPAGDYEAEIVYLAIPVF